MSLYFCLDVEKPAFRGLQTAKGADQPAHQCLSYSLIILGRIISRLARSEISIYLLVSVAEQAGLNLILSETLKTGFIALWPICIAVDLSVESK